MRRAVLLAAGVFAWLASAGVAFHAGCVGDMKSGTFGNPVAALRAESMGMGVLSVACALLAASRAMPSGESAAKRVAAITGIFLVAFIVGTALAYQSEIWGLQYCYRRLAP